MRSLNTNVCRCGTYARIVAAIKLGAQLLQGGAQ